MRVTTVGHSLKEALAVSKDHHCGPVMIGTQSVQGFTEGNALCESVGVPLVDDGIMAEGNKTGSTGISAIIS